MLAFFTPFPFVPFHLFFLFSEFSPVLTAVPDSPTRSTWLGASRFANNKEEFKKVAITRQEYQEHGSSWTGRKFAGML